MAVSYKAMKDNTTLTQFVDEKSEEKEYKE